jgi:hypothetical protein
MIPVHEPPPEIKRRIIEDDRREQLSFRQKYWRRRLNAALSEPATGRIETDFARENFLLEYEERDGFREFDNRAELTEADRRFAFSASGRFHALAQERTGAVITPAEFAEMDAQNRELLSQSHALADRMLAAGFDPYRNTPFGLYRYHVHSRHVEKLPSFRRITFIPHVAQQIRQPILAALESFLERNPFARMWTLTHGPRTGLKSVRAACQKMHRKVSQLAAQPFMREAGVEIVFRSTELGTPEKSGWSDDASGRIERDDAGELTFHPHAHVIVNLTRGFIPPARWKNLLRQVGDFWGAWWKDGDDSKSGMIRDARECCKYVTKPGEMLRLTGPELVALQHELARLHLVQPMGELKGEIKAREAANLRLIRTRTPDGPVFNEVENWNRHGRRARLEANQEAAEKLKKRCEVDALRVVARLLPGFGPAGISEPRVVIMATSWNEDAVRKNPLVQQLIEATRDAYLEGEAIRVHVCTPTVGETLPLIPPESLGPPRRVLTGAELAGFSH